MRLRIGYVALALCWSGSLAVLHAQSPLSFIPVTPCRVADTRSANGPFGGPELAAKSTRNFLIPNSQCNIPANAGAYSLNVTVVPEGPVGFLGIWPSGQTQPLVSTLNSDGRVKANAAIVPAGANGGVAVYVSDASHVILDINGYFVSGNDSALDFYPLSPCRIADTRLPTGALGGPYLSGNVTRTFPVLSSSCNIPRIAQAYSLNFTAIPHQPIGFLSTWPTGAVQPLVSTLNAPTAAVTANAAIVPAGTNGGIQVYSSNDSDVAIDVNGYFATHFTGGQSLYNVTPCRVLDTRNNNGSPIQGSAITDVSASACQIPSSAAALVLNATVVPSPGPSGLSYLALWPTGRGQPVVSTLNAPDGAVTSNMAIVPDAAGSVAEFTTNSTHLILDISGYFAANTAPTNSPFVNFDTGTSGSWVGYYGQEGYLIAAGASSLPSYATVASTGTAFSWTNGQVTTDARALEQSSANPNRIPTAYYNPTGPSFTVDLNLTDSKTHRVSMYFVDWDSTLRNQTVSIIDANTKVILDTQFLSDFHSGTYITWNLKGHVIVQVTSNNNSSPVLSALFFQSPPVVTVTSPAAGATLTRTVNITASAASSVATASVQFQVDGKNFGAPVPVTGPGPYSTPWNTTTVTNGSHTLSAVATDVDGLVGTSAPITVSVANSSLLLPGATFVKFDTATSGNWIGVYGADGEIITNDPQDAQSLPSSYVTVSVSGATPFNWIDSPSDATDPRGLKAIPPGNGSGGQGRNPSAWYGTSFTFDVNVKDGLAHQMALYAVDFDNTLRTETISLVDANTNAVIETRSLTSNFHNGVYLVWNITGHILIKVDYTGPTGQLYSNAVVSGLFFRSFTGNPPTVTLTSPAAGTVSGTATLTANTASTVGLASVRFQLDGTDLGPTVPASANGNYTGKWLTTTTTGQHTLTAIATDVNGQTTTSAPVVVTVSNGAAPAASATFVTTDTTTSGNWVNTYGADGYIIPNGVMNPAIYATTTLTAQGAASPTVQLYSYPPLSGGTNSHPEALLVSPTSTDRIASAFYVPIDYPSPVTYPANSSVISIDMNMIDYQTHQVSFYFTEYGGSSRSEQVQILDASSNIALDTEQVSLFASGKYLTWKIAGHVIIKITEVIPDAQHAPNSVAVNGIFFDPAH